MLAEKPELFFCSGALMQVESRVWLSSARVWRDWRAQPGQCGVKLVRNIRDVFVHAREVVDGDEDRLREGDGNAHINTYRKGRRKRHIRRSAEMY